MRRQPNETSRIHGGGRPLNAVRSLKEVAAILGCSRQNVLNTENRALRKMRIRLKKMGVVC